MVSRQIALLQDILDTCRGIQSPSPSKPRPQHICDSTLPLCTSSAQISYPPLPDPTLALRKLGLSERDTLMLGNAFRLRCSQLQDLNRRELSKMLCCCAPTLHDLLKSSFQKIYLEKVAHFQAELLERAKAQCEKLRSLKPRGNPTKTAFNHDYVPVLEKYFEYNAYPSAADRSLMARKSMMMERQIEVWFQNHRNRARKDGKLLARLRASDPLPSDISFDSLDVTMGDLIRPESERLMMEQQENDDDDSDGIEALASSLNVASSSRAGSVDSELGTPAPTASPRPQQPARDALNPLTPPFAYPSPYVPQLHTFLGATSRPSAFTFPKPTWARQPSATSSNSNSTRISRRDIDAFAELFARLNVRESAKKQGRRRIAALPQSRNSPVPQQRYASPAATCAITTILCPGRHPAFIPSVTPRATRKVRKSPSPPPQPQSWMSSPGAGPSKSSTSTSTAFTFQAPPQQHSQQAAPTNPPVNTSPEASETPTPRRRRKSPQLPRRVPGSPPVAHPYSQPQNQSPSHPTSRRSPRPSPHPYASPSRASSSASSSSSNRVSSSSSSSASSSTPTTPNGSTISLPISYPINTPKSNNTKPTSPMFTAQNIVDIFGDATAFAPPSNQGFSGFGTAGFASPDFGRMPIAGNMFDFNFNASHGPSIVQARS